MDDTDILALEWDLLVLLLIGAGLLAGVARRRLRRYMAKRSLSGLPAPSSDCNRNYVP